MKKKVLTILRENGTLDISHIPTYVTIQGIYEPAKPVKVNQVRNNKDSLEFLAEGSKFWSPETVCIHNTAPRIYDSVMYAYEQKCNNYVLD